MNFSFHPDAENEFNDSIDYYEECQKGLGLSFAKEVYLTIQRIINFPKAWHPMDLSLGIRRCLTNRFPFGVIYYHKEDEIVILAVMQLNRKPDYWQNRIKNKDYYINLRDKYKPKNIKIIFLLESPPISGKYFYDENGSTKEPLFKALMELINYTPKTKKEGLNYFAKQGYFLVDSTYTPVNSITNEREKNQIILNSFEELINDLNNLNINKNTKLILVKANICRLLEKKLIDKGFNVINKNIIIHFPSTGQQTNFKKEISKIFKDNKTLEDE